MIPTDYGVRFSFSSLAEMSCTDLLDFRRANSTPTALIWFASYRRVLYLPSCLTFSCSSVTLLVAWFSPTICPVPGASSLKARTGASMSQHD